MFNGNANFNASTSPVLLQAVNTPQNSLNLRALQVAATKGIAQSSGAAITGAIDSAISDGFGSRGAFMTPSACGVRINFTADPDQTNAMSGPTMSNRKAISDPIGRARASTSRVNDSFAAIDRDNIPKRPRRFAPLSRQIGSPGPISAARASDSSTHRWRNRPFMATSSIFSLASRAASPPRLSSVSWVATRPSTTDPRRSTAG